MKTRHIPYIWFLLGLGACTSYYLSSNLNTWALGQTKASFIAVYPTRSSVLGLMTYEGFEIRAAQRQADSSLIEVGSLRLTKDGSAPTEYWLLFRNGMLEQWGRPDDWQKVSARYQIDFNPNASVRAP